MFVKNEGLAGTELARVIGERKRHIKRLERKAQRLIRKGQSGAPDIYNMIASLAKLNAEGRGRHVEVTTRR